MVNHINLKAREYVSGLSNFTTFFVDGQGTTKTTCSSACYRGTGFSQKEWYFSGWSQDQLTLVEEAFQCVDQQGGPDDAETDDFALPGRVRQTGTRRSGSGWLG